MKTNHLASEEIIKDRKWYIVDAENQVLGRFTSQIASMLRGKHKPAYSPHQDLGDYIIVVNAKKVRITGNKASTKTYFSHTTRPGSGHFISYKQMMELHPERVIEYAVKGMLPKTALGRKMFLKLHVYVGEQHPHQGQRPEKLKLKY